MEKKPLTPEQAHVLWEEGTEAPFSGKLLDVHANGDFHCASCGSLLFRSDAKFDSGTGWPSFSTPATPGAVTLNEDTSHGMRRTEVTCGTCGGHLGHVFPDGPGPTGERYCLNSCVLDFQRND